MVLRRQDKRGLTTLLFTDISGSTEIVVQLGDRRWRTIQSRHHAEVRRQLKRYGGHEVDTAGDGFLATFSSPAEGVRCAFAIVKGVRELGLEVRAGLHIGEAELTGEKVSGIAVTTAARVSAAAGPGQVLVTSTIVQMVAGSDLEFHEIGARELKGVPGTWELSELAAVDDQPIGVPLDPKDAAEARDRSSPPEAPKGSRLRTSAIALTGVLVVLLAGVVLLRRHDSDSTATPPASGSAPTALVALSDGSGDEAFPVDLPALRIGYVVGPILFTGRADTPEAFTWLPVGVRTFGLHVAQMNRTSGVIIDPGSSYFDTNSTTCVCIALAAGRIWTPIATGKPSPGGETLRTSLRGVGLEGEPRKDIPLPAVSGGIAALVSGDGYLWVGDSSTDRVYRIDPTTDEVRRFSLRQSADVLVFADRRLWVLDTLDGRITRVDPSSGHSSPSFTASGNLQGMAVGGGYAWVTDASGNAIQQIPEDLESASTPISVGQIAGSPEGIAYDDGAIVVGFANGTVSKINPTNPSSPEVLWTHSGLGNDASSITVDAGIVWAAGGSLRNV
jgi:class 3 adenylate cyclase